jgi:hypothetical protein
MRRRAIAIAALLHATSACDATRPPAPVAATVPVPSTARAVQIGLRHAMTTCGVQDGRRLEPATLEGKAADGTVVWNRDLHRLIAALPLDDGGMFLFAHPADGAVSERLAPDGRRVWGQRWPEPKSTMSGPSRRVDGPDPRTFIGLAYRGDEMYLAFRETDESGHTGGLDVWTFSDSGELLARRKIVAPGDIGPVLGVVSGFQLFEGETGRLVTLGMGGPLLGRGWSGAAPADPASVTPPEWNELVWTDAPEHDVIVSVDRISARDATGAERWSFGTTVRIAAVVPAWGGLLVVDEACVATALEGGGTLRWTRTLGGAHGTCPRRFEVSIATDERAAVLHWTGQGPVASEVAAIDRDGEMLFAEVLEDGAQALPVIEDGVARLCAPNWSAPLPPLKRGALVPPRPSTVVLETKVEQHLDRPADALAVLGPSDVAVLSGDRLLRWNGKTWQERSIVAPQPPPLTDPPAVAERFVPDRLARGPDGALWISGSRRVRLLVSDDGPSMPTYVGNMPVLLRERRGTTTAVKEVADLLSEQGSSYDHVHVTSRGDDGAVCWLGACRKLRGASTSLIAMPHDAWSISALTLVEGEAWSLGSHLGHGVNGSIVATSIALEPFEEYDRHPRIWGASARDVWIVDAKVRRFDGDEAVAFSVPVTSPRDVWGTARDDVWIAGDDGAAHFDGTRWSRVVGLGAPRLAWVEGSGAGDVWMGGPSGLFRVSSPRPRSITAPTPPDVAREAVRAVRPSALPDPGFTRVTWRPNGRAPLTTALELATAGDAMWIRDDEGVVEHRGGATTVLASRAAIGGSQCRKCLAPRAPGKGIVLGASAPFELGSGPPRRLDPRLASMLAVGMGPRGARIVGGTDERGEPAAWWVDEAAPRWDVPAGCYVAVAASPHPTAGAADPAAEETWLAGGLRCTIDPGGQRWPTGEGILVHHTPTSVRWFRAPAGPLLDVVATGPGEAWAVGVDGAVVHVRAGEVSRSRVEPPVRLHAVLVEGDAVWVGGDDRTLVRLAGERAERVEIAALPPRAAVTSLARHDGALWIASPDGIVRGPR